jgi:hypothetical protein
MLPADGGHEGFPHRRGRRPPLPERHGRSRRVFDLASSGNQRMFAPGTDKAASKMILQDVACVDVIDRNVGA